MRSDVPTEAPEGTLSEAAAAAWIPRTCFKNGPPEQLGIEIEHLVSGAAGPSGRLGAHLPEQRYPILLADLVGREFSGRITLEPGGQLELSSAPSPDLASAVRRTAADLALLRRTALAHGARLTSLSTDPDRPPRRLLRTPRYDAMERFYAAGGSERRFAGRAMMCSSASLQVNVEAAVDPRAARAGDPVRSAEDRWDLLHAVGPALVAAMTNSPGLAGCGAGWRSSRQWIWHRIGPGFPARPAHRPVADWWADRVLDAPLMMVRRSGPDWGAPPGLSFRRWIQGGTSAVPDRPGPDLEDLGYHLTTVFPAVRPRGHLEVRYPDVPPGDWWPVPVATLAALLADRAAADAALDACRGTGGRWAVAGRLGLSDRGLRRAADGLLAAAAAALDRSRTTGDLAVLIDEYRDRWTARGRCPGDDHRSGPDPLSPAPPAPTVSLVNGACL